MLKPNMVRNKIFQGTKVIKIMKISRQLNKIEH